MTTGTIDTSQSLNELLARAPEALPVLQRFGLDTCCGGSLSLAVAAQHHGLELAELVAALTEAVEQAQSDPPPRR
jgi:regulator of cell morphogenesis and NO signaling